MPPRPWSCCPASGAHPHLAHLRDCEDTSAPALQQLCAGTPAALVAARVALSQLEHLTHEERSLEEALAALFPPPRRSWAAALGHALGRTSVLSQLRSCRVQSDPDLLLLELRTPAGLRTLGLRRTGVSWEAVGVDPRAGLWLSPARVDAELASRLAHASPAARRELALLGLRFEARTHLADACATQLMVERPGASTRPAWWAVIGHADWAGVYALRAAACTRRDDEFLLAWEIASSVNLRDGGPAELLPAGLVALAARACR